MEIRDCLPTPHVWPFEDNYVAFHIKVGFSTRNADLDNVLKPLLDTFQWIYSDFNDNKVYYIETEKNIVPKGEEYLWLRIGRYNPKLFQANQQEALIEKQQDQAKEKPEPEVTRGSGLLGINLEKVYEDVGKPDMRNGLLRQLGSDQQ